MEILESVTDENMSDTVDGQVTHDMDMNSGLF